MGAITRGADGKVLVVGIKQAQLRESVSFAEVEAIQWGLWNNCLCQLKFTSFNQDGQRFLLLPSTRALLLTEILILQENLFTKIKIYNR